MTQEEADKIADVIADFNATFPGYHMEASSWPEGIIRIDRAECGNRRYVECSAEQVLRWKTTHELYRQTWRPMLITLTGAAEMAKGLSSAEAGRKAEAIVDAMPGMQHFPGVVALADEGEGEA